MFKIDSFRNQLLALFAGLSFVLGLCIILYIGKMATQQISAASGQALYTSAKSISNTFAIALAEREREMVLLSQSPFFMETNFDDPRLLTKLNQVKESYKYYAWLGIATPEGTVAVAANQLLKGADVSERPWFKGGLKQIYLGDVHEAVLLAKKLKAINPNEPMRFIDFATPIYDRNHEVRGVLAAHSDWSWASQALESSLPEDATQKGIEVFIVNAKGEILYPFKSIGHVVPPALNKSKAHYFVDDWNEDRQYLTVDVPIISDTKMSLGWHVIIRQPMTYALADVRELQQHIIVIGLIILALMLVLTYKLANRFSQPIEKLAQTAQAVARGQVQVDFEQNTTIKEIQDLSASLTDMTNRLLTQSNQLQEANFTLEQKVMDRTQALQLANAELEKLARHDALTGLHNRHALNARLQYLFEQFKRNQQFYTVLMIDIDHFKKVNDTHGHEIGDYVLQSTAKILTDILRTTDFSARLGGEEFIVILPATDLDGAAILAEKIRLAISSAEILANPVTVSIGVSLVKHDDADPNVAVRRADMNLYRAKEHGRNQVVVDSI